MKEIIQFIDDYLENNNLESISAVDANRLLDEKGLLKDSDSRKGLPLRKKLRNGEIPHAYQIGVFWRIPSSRKSNKTTKTVSPLYNKTMPDKSIRFNSDYSISESENELIEMTYFKDAKNISERDVPESPGLYCIRLKNTNDFPVAFNQYFSEIMNAIIYIGMASKNLRKRLYSQELHAKGHGTFFRSLGAVLGFMPPKGSLKNKKNKNNYKFSKADENEIIKWIEHHLMVNWIFCNSNNLEDIEKELIGKYMPVLNLNHNPSKLDLLLQLREECKRIANS